MAAPTEAAKAELKQQGAFEAARDPSTNVTAADAIQLAEKETKKAGITALSFNPDASPEEKAAQARSRVPENFHHEHKPKGVAIATDIDTGGPSDYDLPPPTTAGAIEPVPFATDKEGHALTNATNGVLTKDEHDAWAEKYGWAPRFGNGENFDHEGSLLDHQTWIEGKLDEKFFGDWYHNAAVIVFACLSSWFVAVLGGGLAWVFLIMAVCGTYYRTSLRRVRRNFRDDVHREMAKAKLENDHESLEWMNGFMMKFWPIYAPVISETVVASVDQVLSTSTPAFLDSMRMRFFTLGSKPPRMEHVKSYPRAEDDIVMMDWKFSFTPNDTADMTANQLKNKVNPKVVLEIRIGKGMISKAMDIIVEDFAFSGLMRVKMKLQIPFPHIEKVEICFMERPTIDYVCKPLGGEHLGFDINFIPGLEGFILEQIHANLAPIMYNPNVFPIEVAKMLSGSAVDQAIGVVAVTLYGAEGLKNPDKFAGTPDPYTVVSLNGREALAQTKIIKENANPKWNETKFIIVSSFTDSLTLQVFDYNEFRKDKELGTATFALDKLENINEYDNEQLEVMANGKPRGLITADIRFFPVLEGRKLEDGTTEPPPVSNTGIARFSVEQAKDLDGSKSLVNALNPYAVLLLNGKQIHTSRILKRTNNPIWDNAHKEILITDRKSAKLGLVIKDDRGLSADPILGTYQIKLDDMVSLMDKGQEWYNLAGAKTGRAKMTLQWKPVALTGVAAGSGGYVTPIGVMRIHFKNARDLRNMETMGKSDPYARVLLSGISKGRTVTFQNNLNPDWDEVIYVPMHTTREKLTLEVMDEENLGKDRSLGQVEVLASDFIKQADNGEYLVHDLKTQTAAKLRMHGKGNPKGILNYDISFYSCLNVADPEEDEKTEAETESGEAMPEGRTKSTADAGRLKSLSISRPNGDSSGDLAKALVEGEKQQHEADDEKTLPKLRLSPEELLGYNSGLIVFKLMDADLIHSDVHVEITVDDMAFPSYRSSTAKARKYKFDEIGDCFIRELDFSKLTIRLRQKVNEKGGDQKKDQTFARLAGNTIEVLKQCLNNPTILKLKDPEGRVNSIRVSLKYIPVKMNLDPSESINNSGTLRLDVLDAKDLPSADRNGYSDPFCKFELNGKDIFKTQVQKKTLQPAWNEFFETDIPSRTAANFICKVYDWDFASEPDHLGTTAINLNLLEPFKPQEYNLALDGKSGTIRLRALFRPAYVTRSRQGSSTFSGTFAVPGKVVTGVAGVPIKGVGMAAHGVGKVGRGVGSFIGHGFRGKSKDGIVMQPDEPTTPTGDGFTGLRRATGLVDTDASPVVSPPGAAMSSNVAIAEGSPHGRTKSIAGSTYTTGAGGAPTGSVSFEILSASGYPAKESILVLVKNVASKKVLHKTKHLKSSDAKIAYNGESFTTKCTADTQFQIQVKSHSTFGSDDDLGEAIVLIDESGAPVEKIVKVGEGTVTLKSSFIANSTESGGNDAASLRIPSAGVRRSFLSKRENGRASREVTPSTS